MMRSRSGARRFRYPISTGNVGWSRSPISPMPIAMLRTREVAFVVTERRSCFGRWMAMETISGSVAAMQRPAFARLVDRLKADDVLIVTRLDRLGRNAMDVAGTIEQLVVMGVRVHCLQLDGTDLTSAAGRMVMTVIGAMAQFERVCSWSAPKPGWRGQRPKGLSLGALRHWPPPSVKQCAPG